MSKYVSIWLITTRSLNKNQLMVTLVLSICEAYYIEILIVLSKENANNITIGGSYEYES